MSNWKISKRIDDAHFIKVAQEAKTMALAAVELGIHFNSFKKRALILNCYNPNQAGVGINKKMPKIPIEDIIYKNLYPSFNSYKLKKRLYEENIKQNICEICNVENWNGKKLEMELHHIDGNRTNHHLSNLMLLCPNCHSQTDTFRGKNKKI